MAHQPSSAVASRAWDGHARLAIVGIAVVLTALSPPAGTIVDLVVAVWAHRAGAKFARNALLALAVIDVLWIVLGVGSGSTGLGPAG